jgi:hypothetical protein
MKIKINTQFILDIFVSGILTLFSMTVISIIIPEGLTAKFLFRGSKIVGLVSFILGIIFIFLWLFNKSFKLKKKFELPEIKDFALLALPMSPVIDFAIINIEYLNQTSLVYLIGITLLFTLTFSFILPILFSYFASFKILMISGLALSFTVLTMAKISNNPTNHILNSQFLTQGVYLIFSFVILYLIYSFNKRVAVTVALFFMITGIFVNLLNYTSSNSIKANKSDRLLNFLNNDKNKIIQKKNIYLLVYESYPNLETLEFYGFDNTDQINFLEENGFKIYHGSYSSGGLSIASTSRLLDIKGKISQHGRYYLSGNAFSLDVLRANGYKTVALFKSPHFFGSYPITWDEYYPEGDVKKMGGKTLTKAIFEGEFRFDIFDDNFKYEKYLELKNKYLTTEKNSTLFYTHNSYPGHSQNSGKCRKNEKEIYFKKMKKANKEMKNDVLNLINNDPNSIIVLLSDHGPYLTKNCRELRNYNQNKIDRFDIQDRYGAFLSIYWPEDINHIEHNIEIIQDIFPTIFANITDNKNLFNELKIERKFFDRFKTKVGGVNVYNGIIQGGKDHGLPLFKNRSYELQNN